MENLPLENCEISQLKQDKRRIFSENAIIIIKQAKKINNWIDCDYIQSMIEQLGKTKKIKELKSNACDLKEAILFRLNESNKNQLIDDYIVLVKAQHKIDYTPIYTSDLFKA